MGMEWNVVYQNDVIVVVDIFKCVFQMFGWVFEIVVIQLGYGFGDMFWCVEQVFVFWIVFDLGEQCVNCGFGFFVVGVF